MNHHTIRTLLILFLACGTMPKSNTGLSPYRPFPIAATWYGSLGTNEKRFCWFTAGVVGLTAAYYYYYKSAKHPIKQDQKPRRKSPSGQDTNNLATTTQSDHKTSCSDTLPTVWQLTRRCELESDYVNSAVQVLSTQIALTNDRLIESSGETVRHTNLASEQQEISNTLSSHVTRLAASAPLPDGSSYVTAATKESTPQKIFLHIWHVKSSNEGVEKPTTVELECHDKESIDSLVFSPNGTYLAAAGYKHITVLQKRNGSPQGGDTATFSMYRTFELENTDPYLPINLSFTQNTIVTSLYGGKARELSLISGLTTDPQYHIGGDSWSALHYSKKILMHPANTLCAIFNYKMTDSLAEGCSVYLLDIRTAARVDLPHPKPSLEEDKPWATTLAFGPHGTIVGGFDSGEIIVWKKSTDGYKIVSTIKIQHARKILSVAISPDGNTIAAHTSSGDVYIFRKQSVGMA